MSKRRVTLVPWDAGSSVHVQELFEQRVQCGWNADMVESWKKEQEEGSKCIYWVVIPDDVPDQEDLIKRHLEAYPKPGILLTDTGTSLNGKPIDPSGKKFQPIGHISLDPDNKSARTLDLDLPKAGEGGSYWITTFYISAVLQRQGFGGAAMNEVEAMAVLEPLCAKTLMLDTLLSEDQCNPIIANPVFGGVPKVSNQEWYARRGYKLIGVVKNHYQRTVTAMIGPGHDTSTVFMRRDIVD